MNSIGASNTKPSKALYSVVLLGLVVLFIWFTSKAFNSQIGQAHKEAADFVVANESIARLSKPSITVEALVADQQSYSTHSTHSTPKSLINNLGANTLIETEIDGAVRTDANGNLIVDQALRDYFDYFLSASDEIGPEAAIQAAIELIQQSLPTAAAEQASELFQRYLHYLKEQYRIGDQPLIGEFNNDKDALLVLRETTQTLRDVRGRLFTEQESQALFGLEDANTEFTLKSLELSADESLSLDQRRAEIERLQSELPEALQDNIETTAQQKEAQTQIQSVLNQDLDDAQLYTELEDLNLSPEHIDELLTYRQNQNYFEQQYQRYATAKTQSGDASNNESLLTEYFTTPEDQTKARLRDLSSQ